MDWFLGVPYTREGANECSPRRKPRVRGSKPQPHRGEEELTYVGIENPGPGVSTWTRAGCSNESANERGENPASGWARNTGERITHPPVGALPWVWRRGSL
ncbi:MAG: hypothetical protein AUG89_08075 [Acidobacteria bacterium 13_1_20CM_4_56_7]|nr:MAG: hypothetical protein AUG89_08075 [Acidobacteria bacterium 13_1_20CM_4_56_7]